MRHRQFLLGMLGERCWEVFSADIASNYGVIRWVSQGPNMVSENERSDGSQVAEKQGSSQLSPRIKTCLQLTLLLHFQVT